MSKKKKKGKLCDIKASPHSHIVIEKEVGRGGQIAQMGQRLRCRGKHTGALTHSTTTPAPPCLTWNESTIPKVWTTAAQLWQYSHPEIKITTLYRELSLVLCGNQEAWDGGGGRLNREGICEYFWLIHVVVWQKPTQHCQAIILQLKIKINKLKITML